MVGRWDAGRVDGILFNITLVVLFVLIGGYFSASELALVSLRESQVSRMATQGRRGARVARLRQDSNRFLAAVQIGVTLAGFFSAAYGGSTLAHPLGLVVTRLGLSQGLADTLALIVVTAAISYLSLVLGELVPKRVALQRAERISLVVAPVLDRIASLFRPVIWLLSRSTDVVVRLLGLDPKAGGEQVTEEELRDMVVTQQQLTVEERRVLTDVFDATDRKLSEVMVPRTEVDFLLATTPLSQAAHHVLSRPHSRYPVIEQTPDDVIGFVHVRDLLSALLIDGTSSDNGDSAQRPRTVGDIVRPVTLLPGSVALLPALSQLRAGGGHLAVIVDEYGGTDGIVTLEDLIEELVGEIQDEYDPAAAAGSAAGNYSELDGLMNRDEVQERAGIVLPEGRYDTLGGFIQSELGRIPNTGDSFDALGHRFTVVEMDGRRVARVSITPTETT
jgi:putative hemolysin